MCNRCEVNRLSWILRDSFAFSTPKFLFSDILRGKAKILDTLRSS